MALEQEIARLNTLVASLSEQKEKYKTRTKELLATLENIRLSQQQDSESLMQQTLSLRQLNDQNEIEIRRLRQQLAEQRSVNEVLQEDNRSKALHLNRAVFDSNIEKALALSERQNAELSTQLRQQEQREAIYIQTLQSFLQLFNCVKPKTAKWKYAKIYNQLSEASKGTMLPVFIDEDGCSMQLLIQAENELQLPLVCRSDVYSRMYAKAQRLDANQEPSFKEYLDQVKKELDGGNGPQKLYLAQQNGSALKDIDFIPRKAVVAVQNFSKVQKARGCALPQGDVNNLLVTLSAVFHEYCQGLQADSARRTIEGLQRELSGCQRQLLQSKPYSQVQSEQEAQRLRAVAQKYKDLYEEAQCKKSISRSVVVKVGGSDYKSSQLERLREEVRMLRKIVQLRKFDGNVSGQQELRQYCPGSQQDYQNGCLAAGKILISCIQAALGELYDMKADPAVTQRLRDCQQHCREVLMGLLDGELSDAEDVDD